MRVGMVCPYSLTIPGGVQAQVLGLARALRADGHTVQVLAPCDGPPPEDMVTPLGKSIPFATNGSVAPIAPDPSCARRTIRALREGQVRRAAPARAARARACRSTRCSTPTFRRSGPSTAPARPGPTRCWRRSPSASVDASARVSRSPRTPSAPRSTASTGSTRALQRHRGRALRPRRALADRRSPDHPVRGPSRVAQGSRGSPGRPHRPGARRGALDRR